MPKFSIIIPCFNAGDTIDSTLASIQAQSCGDWEAICIDDGSCDETRDRIALAAARDGRISLHQNPGKGPSAARNAGALSLAKGPLVAFCDADDQWAAEKLEQVGAAFEDAGVAGAFGRIAFFTDTPEDAAATSTVTTQALSVDMLLGENPVCTMSNMTVRRDAFIATAQFDETMVHNEDLDWLIRLVGSGAKVIGLPVVQTYYRASAAGLSADLDAMHAGRARALASAARLGFRPSAKAHAIHQRYLARRALRLGLSRSTALHHALAGLVKSPHGFLSPMRRGALTLIGALCAAVLPRKLSRSLFS